ncbi:MAG TPA: hypothetical protein VFQ92_23325 [Blastocatellia bacterium]|nr:hypothetical protein [Blastocatellia bacterium]
MGEDERAALCTQHSELDHSVVSDTFYEIAANPIIDAKKYWPDPSTRDLIGQLDEEDIHMVLRVLQYAKYCSLGEHPDTLAMSPIHQFGLENYYDPEQLTQSEVDSIRWEFSDILYHEKKEKTIEECKDGGIDLEQQSIHFSDNSLPEVVDNTTEALINLLKHKMDYDLAALKVVLTSPPDKYKRYVSNRLYNEYLTLLVKFRTSIDNTLTIFTKNFDETAKLTRVRIFHIARETENYLEPFKQRFETLRSKVPTTQPSSEAYNQVLQLVKSTTHSGPPKQDFNFRIGEFTMGDKYNVGQAGAVGPHSHAHDMNFNQIWNQMSGDVSPAQLADDLAKLREALLKEAKEPEEYSQIGAVASAEVEAKNGQGSKALEYLSKTGKWVLDVATKIGTTVAAAAIKESLGIK